MNTEPIHDITLRIQQVWHGTHKDISFKIVHWAEGEAINDGKGVWNYYVFLHESKTPNFNALWLADEEKAFSPNGRKYISHDYGSAWVSSDCDWHGGVTYYAKHGHTEGHRAVEFGCDYSHLWDAEAGFDTELRDVVYDARNTIEQIAERLESLKTALPTQP